MYSFLAAHWAPLYLRFRLHGRGARVQEGEEVFCYVPTRDGLRRVVRAAEGV